MLFNNFVHALNFKLIHQIVRRLFVVFLNSSEMLFSCHLFLFVSLICSVSHCPLLSLFNLLSLFIILSSLSTYSRCLYVSLSILFSLILSAFPCFCYTPTRGLLVNIRLSSHKKCNSIIVAPPVLLVQSCMKMRSCRCTLVCVF